MTIVQYKGFKNKSKNSTTTEIIDSAKYRDEAKIDEEQMQMSLMFWARFHPICSKYLIHVPMQRMCTPWYGAKLKALGARKGFVDIFLAYPSKGHGGLFMELKVGNNKLTADQKEFLELMGKANFATHVVYNDWEDAKKIILEYLDDKNANGMATKSF